MEYDQRENVDSNLRKLIEILTNVTENYEQERSKLQDAAQVVNRSLQEYNKNYHDKRRKKCSKYKVGDLVLVKVLQYKPGTNRKLSPKFKGPYQIKAVLNKNRYVVTDIPGYNLTQRPLNTIMSPDKIKPWIRITSDEPKSAEQSELSNSEESDDV